MVNPQQYQDREVVGLDKQGCVVQWSASQAKPYSSGVKLADWGVHNLREREIERVGVGLTQWQEALSAHGVRPDAARNIEAQEYAKKILARYARNEKVEDLYDDDEQFANALCDLAGSEFEYPEYAGLNVGQAIAKATKMASPGSGLPLPTKYSDGSERNAIHLEIDQLPALGLARITSVGSENIYMEKNGLNYYCKVMATERYQTGDWHFVENRSLQSNKMAVAEEAYQQYDLGEGVMVEAQSGWEYSSEPAAEWTRTVHVVTDDNDIDCPTTRLAFTVRFDVEGALQEAYAIDSKGQIWGFLPAKSDLHMAPAANEIEAPRAPGM